MLFEEDERAAVRLHSGLRRSVFSARPTARRRRKGFAWVLNQILLLGLLIILVRLWVRYQEDRQSLPQRELEPIELGIRRGISPAQPAPASMPAAEEGGAGSEDAQIQSEAAGEAEPSARPAAEAARQDNLKVIEGIGPKIEVLLRSSGINTFEELAGTEESRLAEILEDAGLRLANPGTWPEQARLAAAGDMEALQQLKGQLKAGRRA